MGRITINSWSKHTKSETKFINSLNGFLSNFSDIDGQFLRDLCLLFARKIIVDWFGPTEQTNLIVNRFYSAFKPNFLQVSKKSDNDFLKSIKCFKFYFLQDLNKLHEPVDSNISDASKEIHYLSIEFLYDIFEIIIGAIIDIKGSGSYYTPKEITEYICSTSIDYLLSDFINSQSNGVIPCISFLNNYSEIPEENLKDYYTQLISRLSTLRIADISCGSGAFLLSAADNVYTKICNLHERFGVLNELNKFDLKRKIVKDCIYGVEINEDACFLAIILLNLWVLNPGFSNQANQANQANQNNINISRSYLTNIQDPSIFPIENNVKCGNSLLGWVGSEDELQSLNDLSNWIQIKNSELRKKLNNLLYEKYNSAITKKEFNALKPFHWNIEFDSIFPGSEFDLVVGNPPYLDYFSSKAEKEYIFPRNLIVQIYGVIKDLYEVFLMRAKDLCCGICSFIVPYNVFRGYAETIIPNLIRYDNLGEDLFDNMKGATAILFYRDKSRENNKFEFRSYLGIKGSQKMQELGKVEPKIVSDFELWKDNEVITYLLTNSNRYSDYNLMIQRGEELGKKSVKNIQGIPIFSAAEMNPFYLSDTEFRIPESSIKHKFYNNEKIGFNLSFRNRIKAAYIGKRIVIKSIICIFNTDRNNLMQILGIWNSTLFDWFHMLRYSQFEERRVNRIVDVMNEYPIMLNDKSALPYIVPFLICNPDCEYLRYINDLLVMELFFAPVLYDSQNDQNCELRLSKRIIENYENNEELSNFNVDIWKWIEMEELRQTNVGKPLEPGFVSQMNEIRNQITKNENLFVGLMKNDFPLNNTIASIEKHPWFLLMSKTGNTYN